MYTEHNHCRACGYARPGTPGTKCCEGVYLETVLDLGIQPLANDFCRQGEERSGYAPLKLLVCPSCGLGQLSVVVRPEILYRRYSYVTSTSKMMQDHFSSLLALIQDETEGRDVLEIGSNDGRFLSVLKNEGYNVLGVDPAANLAKVAEQNGIHTQQGFFGEDLSRILPPSDIVIARHVFCHVPDWHDFIRGLESITHRDSVIFIEVPYARDLIQKFEFDTIYHEHLSYLTLRSVEALLRSSRLQLQKVIEFPIHGGAVVLVIRRRDCDRAEEFKIEESISMSDWRDMGNFARQQIGRLRQSVVELRNSGKRIAGLGASAKSTVWVNACGFSREEILFIADCTPQKQWTTSPGSDIPITDEGAILRELPDYVIMWAWNYREEILAKFSRARELGVKFIVPIPSIEII